MTTYQQHLEHAMRTRTADHPAWRYNDKLAGRELAALAGVRPPELYQGPCSLETFVPPHYPAVLKPVHGCSSLGVFPLVPDGGRYRDLLRGDTLTWRQVRTAAYKAKHRHDHIPEHPDAIHHPWIIEELILDHDGSGPADDWKAFVIGGRVQAVRQCLRRTGDPVRVRWYDHDWSDIGNIMPTRKWTYDAGMPEPRHPDALTSAFERVAAHVESPFIRVDLYEDDDGPVFGEITPHPGGGGTPFVPEWDQRLGDAWTTALSTSSTSSGQATTTTNSATR